MECFELNGSALLPQQFHHELQILWVRNVLSHHIEIVSIQQQLAQQLEYILLIKVNEHILSFKDPVFFPEKNQFKEKVLTLSDCLLVT